MTNNAEKDYSYVVVAYVVLFIFIAIGGALGWIGHMAFSNSKNVSASCVCEKK